MAYTTWSDRLLSHWESRTVAEQIDEVQRLYRRWTIVPTAIIGAGIVMIALISHPTVLAASAVLSLTGVIAAAVLKLWVHIKLSALRVVYELQKH